MASQRYRDINPAFIAHPVTGDVSTFDDVGSIRFSVRNLISTNFGERQYRHDIGSNVTGLLFDLNDPSIASSLERAVRETLTNFEPRVTLLKLDINQNVNSLTMRLTYRIRATSQTDTLDINLKRVR